MTPSVSPLSSPSGLIYRYVLQSPDRSPMELKTFEDWIVEPAYKSVPGVADDSGFGGGDHAIPGAARSRPRSPAPDCPSRRSKPRWRANNGNAGGGFYSQGGQFYYVRGLGRIDTLEDIGNVVLAVHNGTPVLVKDVGRVEIGIAPRLGEFGFEKQDDAVEGVILLRTGEKTQDVLKRVEAKTQELNEQILPKDVKVVPFYDRSDLIALTTEVVEDNLLRGMLLVVVMLIFFLYDIRAGLIVAVDHSAGAAVRLHLPGPAARLRQPAVHRRHRFRHPGRWRRGHGGEHLPPDRAARGHAAQRLSKSIRDAAAEVDRPLFYAVAVIVAGFLPIYVLSGPSGTLFKPMADTMVFALIGSLIVTLTLLPVLCAWFMRNGVRERRNAVFEGIKSAYAAGLDFCLAHPWRTTLASRRCCWRCRCC